WMVSRYASRWMNGRLRLLIKLSADKKAAVRSPQMARRHALMLSSRRVFLNFRFRNVSRNCRVDVWSNTCEQTFPPVVHGEAIISGTRYPRPMAAPRASFLLFPSASSCSSEVYSMRGSMPAEHFPLFFRFGLGGTNGGT